MAAAVTSLSTTQNSLGVPVGSSCALSSQLGRNPSHNTTFNRSSATRTTSHSSCVAGKAFSLWTHGSAPSPKPEKSSFVELEPIASEEQFDLALAQAQERSKPIIVDWMAAWCRKCIYLKPKLEKLAAEFQQDAKFYYVDVNTVPQALVKRADVTKMPTIQLWKNGEKCDEVIGGHKAWLVVDEVREMLQKHVR